VTQLALPLETATRQPAIVRGRSNDPALAAMAAAASWPFRTAVLTGPARSGKSLLARSFEAGGLGEAIDDADSMAEEALFHRWNRAQQAGAPLLLVSSRAPGAWPVALPDLASRLGAALLLEIGQPDDALLAALAEEHAERRGLVLGEGVLAWLVPRIERSYAAVEQVIESADRLSLERGQPVTISLLRDAVDGGRGGWQPRLL
jgi:chromosomal replication initiation ATPase DnaA